MKDYPLTVNRTKSRNRVEEEEDSIVVSDGVQNQISVRVFIGSGCRYSRVSKASIGSWAEQEQVVYGRERLIREFDWWLSIV